MFRIEPHLFAVPVDGSGPMVRLTADVAAGGGSSLTSFALAPDGRSVAYRADPRASERFELFAAPVDGGSAPLRLSGRLPAGGDVLQYGIDALSRRVVYLADQRFDGVQELYSVPLLGARHVRRSAGDGSLERVRLSPTPQPSMVQTNPPFGLSPDGSRVVFGWGISTGRAFAAPVDGAAPALDLGTGVHRFVFASGGATVLLERGQAELCSVPADGSAPPLVLNERATFDLRILEFAASARWAVYHADERTDERFELFARPLDASLPRLVLNGPLVAGGDVGGTSAAPTFLVAPGEQHVVYLADQETSGRHELFSSPLPDLH